MISKSVLIMFIKFILVSRRILSIIKFLGSELRRKKRLFYFFN